MTLQTNHEARGVRRFNYSERFREVISIIFFANSTRQGSATSKIEGPFIQVGNINWQARRELNKLSESSECGID